jgi:tripartite-type tricarboxylate transporter receptor subunit TctC
MNSGKAGTINMRASSVGRSTRVPVQAFAVPRAGYAKSQVTFVPYKGNPPMMLDLSAGRLQVGTASLETALPFIHNGQLRAIAVTGAGRVEQLPGVAAAREFPGMHDYVLANWYGFFAPAGTPPAVIRKLAGALTKVARTPRIAQELRSESSTLVLSSPDTSKARIDAEVDRWKALIEQTGIRP